ncbi:MAG: prephenate dehydrogenase/arogenate dehydrogenase family protein, partial [Polyangia bacterium]
MIYARAALIGCGMVGGSLMAALRAAGKIRRIVGFDVEPYHAASAQAAGIIDEVAVDAAAAVSGCELVVIAVPVRAIEALFAEIAHS